jgi:hypothetical protein
MGGFGFSIDTTEFVNMLKALPEKVAGKAVGDALAAGGAVLADAMQEEAPERTDDPTPGSNSLPPGILKEDISFQVQQRKGYNPRVKVGCTEVSEYVAYWIENGHDVVVHGHLSRAEKSSRRILAKHQPKSGMRHVEANPFMARAFDSSIEAATDAALTSLQESLADAMAAKE